MGGKARRRREKNYQAAHGGHTRLPPPPNSSHLDRLPSKLRTLLSFSSPTDNTNSPTYHPAPIHQNRSKDTLNQKKGVPVNEVDAGDAAEEKKKNKRKRKEVNDLRFENILGNPGNKKRDRKKKYLEEKKKKKQKKSETEEELAFPGREQIKFGDVVQAPPKLAVPKKLTNVQEASRERLRLQAIESYRNRKGWISRPGLQLPAPVTSTPLL